MAGFEGPMYRSNVSQFPASSRAIRRPDQPLRANVLIASQVLTQRCFIALAGSNNRARSAMNLFTLRHWLVFNRPLLAGFDRPLSSRVAVGGESIRMPTLRTSWPASLR